MSPLPLQRTQKEKQTLLPKAEIKCGLIFSSHNKFILSEIDVSM